MTGPPAPGAVEVLANPTARRGRHHALLPEVLARLSVGHDLPVRPLVARTGEEAETVCRAAVARGAAALIAVGGDGTVHRALQAVAGTGVPFGIVPAGTGNDLAAALGLPEAPLAAASAAAVALAAGHTTPVDLARVEGERDGTRPAVRWFGAVLGAGYDALVNERANRMRRPRGRLRYDLAIVAELARLRPRRYALRLDGEALELDAVLVAVGNTATYGGGLRICPDADPTDGLLDVVIAGPVSRTTLLRLRPRLHDGTHVGHPAVRYLRAREVRLAADGIVAYADGERLAPLPLTVTAVPGALTLLAG